MEESYGIYLPFVMNNGVKRFMDYKCMTNWLFFPPFSSFPKKRRKKKEVAKLILSDSVVPKIRENRRIILYI